MSSIVISFPGLPVTAQSLVSGSVACHLTVSPLIGARDAREQGAGAQGIGARGEGARPVFRRARVLAQVEGMRERGMSDTGIRRALGLSEQQAVEAGIIPARPEAVTEDGPPMPEAAAPGATVPVGGRVDIGRGPLMAEVLAAVARAGGVDSAEIMGPSQGRHLTPLRQLTMYLLREVCVGASLPAIGHFLGRDHTTVHYGCRKAAQRLRTDPDFRRLYHAIRGAWASPKGPADG